MELQDYMGQVVARFIPFGDYVDLDARQEHGLHRTHHRQLMVLLHDMGQVEACFSPFGDSVNLDT